MKKLTKILLVTCVAVITAVMTLVTSFATSTSGDPERTDVFLPSQNLNNIQIGLGTYYTDGSPNLSLGNYSIGQPSCSYFQTASGSETRFSYGYISPYFDSYAIANFTSSASGGRLFTRIQSSVYAFQNKIPTYTDVSGVEIIDGNPYAWFTNNVIFTFDEFIYLPSLTQGEFTLSFTRSSLIKFFEENQDTEYQTFHLRDDITYSGILLYPTYNNSYVEIPFEYTHTLGAVNGWETTTDGNLQLRTSLVPCEHSSITSFDKLTSEEIYTYALTSYDGDKTNLIPPKYLADKPIALQDYSVRADVRYTRNRDGVELPVGLPAFSSVHFGIPSSLNGVPRVGERITDFSDIGQAKVDIEEFSFFDWIVTIITGVASAELFPGFPLLLPLGAIISLSLIVWILKVFVGG